MNILQSHTSWKIFVILDLCQPLNYWLKYIKIGVTIVYETDNQEQNTVAEVQNEGENEDEPCVTDLNKWSGFFFFVGVCWK